MSKYYNKNGSQPFYPVSYAKVHSNSVTDNIYLDIVNTYTRADYTRERYNGRWRNVGFIVDKLAADKLKIKIVYTK